MIVRMTRTGDWTPEGAAEPLWLQVGHEYDLPTEIAEWFHNCRLCLIVPEPTPEQVAKAEKPAPKKRKESKDALAPSAQVSNGSRKRTRNRRRDEGLPTD